MTSVAEYIEALPDHQRALGEQLEQLLTAGLPAAAARLWHSHPVWMVGKQPIAGFKAFPQYITLLLWQGQRIKDESKLLSPSGSAEMAVLKLSSLDELDSELLASWLSQLARL
ncbi:DUF1801 domain-containing protein [Psychromicrobium lacuslunae]|uniref:YdhG-like domain-containing protein n=1 Tax=Psychromicrobium lacuslunae TaxID=1618207 RepID=A0A0D4BX89_9MICC|nr:DUF1801 domain-containing protein [Psychromicrobium lacuslunae]AJT41047.1 hypothetical protein UM93_05080 [Psychromicrobium lacuslunae]